MRNILKFFTENQILNHSQTIPEISSQRRLGINIRASGENFLKAKSKYPDNFEDIKELAFAFYGTYSQVCDAVRSCESKFTYSFSKKALGKYKEEYQALCQQQGWSDQSLTVEDIKKVNEHFGFNKNDIELIEQ